MNSSLCQPGPGQENRDFNRSISILRTSLKERAARQLRGLQGNPEINNSRKPPLPQGGCCKRSGANTSGYFLKPFQVLHGRIWDHKGDIVKQDTVCPVRLSLTLTLQLATNASYWLQLPSNQWEVQLRVLLLHSSYVVLCYKLHKHMVL